MVLFVLVYLCLRRTSAAAMTAMTITTAAPAINRVSVVMPDAGSTPADGETVGATVCVGASVGAVVCDGVGVGTAGAAASGPTERYVVEKDPP